MLENIAPGAKVNVKIVKEPTNAAARKTLVRVLSKDADVKRENDRLRSVRERNMLPTQRGGRTWFVRLIKQRPVKGGIGESGTVVASVDVLRDLGSVQRFIEVSPA